MKGQRAAPGLGVWKRWAGRVTPVSSSQSDSDLGISLSVEVYPVESCWAPSWLPSCLI